MPEHTIPATLLDNIRSGRAALVIGAGIGVPSWKQLLERMNDELRSRGGDSDEAAVRDVDKLLHKGSLVPAAGFLGRALGEEICDRVIADVWRSPGAVPDLVKSLGRLPFRQVWTTFPGDLIERGMKEVLPEDWPSPQVRTYADADAVDPRRRTVLKILGDYSSYVATPRSVRRALAGADDLRELIRPFYAEGSLLFVGFRHGDPDLAALLDRVFGAFEPPEVDHYLVAAQPGPVAVDELAADHHIEVIGLAGKGVDDVAQQSLIDFISNLEEACAREGITLSRARPDAGDLEGWLAVLSDDASDDDALDALEEIETKAREAGDGDRMVEVLMGRIEMEGSGPDRARLLRHVAKVFEDQLGDVPRAFTALTAALREDPADSMAVDEAERLADDADGWSELVADVAEVAGEIQDHELAAAYLSRLGRWYHKKLSHPEYAVASLREAIRRDRSRLDAYAALADVYRSQQRWGELADLIERQIELEERPEAIFDHYLSLGDLCETQLAATSRAVDAYEAAIGLEVSGDDAYVALERLYRQSERWGQLTKVLERHAEHLDAAGESQRSGALRSELADLRAKKLGDIEGAISKREAELVEKGDNLETLRALEDLYDKAGRQDDYLGVLQKLAPLVDEKDRISLLRRLAAELEEHDDKLIETVEALEQLIEVAPEGEDAYRSLDRVYAGAGRHEDRVSALERQVLVVRAPQERAALHMKIADIFEEELSDPHRAVDALVSALGEVEENRDLLRRLGKLYQRTEQWQQAVDILVQHAELEGGHSAAELYCQAGTLMSEKLGDGEGAVEVLEKGLAALPQHLDSHLALASAHKRLSAWENARRSLEAAVDASQNRRQKVELLVQAADIAESRLDNTDAAHALRQRVLEIDPEHTDAGQKVVEYFLARGQKKEALPILQMLVRRTPEDDRLTLNQREFELATVCMDVGEYERAALHFERAAKADKNSFDASVGLAGALFEQARDQGNREIWQQVEKRCREVLVRHANNLADGQVTDLWHRIGVATHELGDERKSIDGLRRALERDPRHAPSLEMMIEVAEARKDFKTVAECKRALIDTVSGDDRAGLLEEIGDICHQQLNDAEHALGAYLEAIKLKPDSHVLLHKVLEVYTASKQWQQAVQTLSSIAHTESDLRRRAKYHYAAAVICRDELKDVDSAVEHFQTSLDDDPETSKAFEAVDQLLTEKQDWRGLARAYRKMLKRLGEDAEPKRLLALWSRLGEICNEHLGDSEAAIAAFEVASSIDPGDVDLHEALVNLYLDAGDSRRADAIEELQTLLRHEPERVELYKALSSLYQAEGELDKAYCLAQALVFLNAASDGERQLYERIRPQRLEVARRRLTEELWQKAIIHGREDRHVNAIFASMIGPIAATTAQPSSAFDIDEKATGSGDLPAAKVFNYATGVLALSPAPRLSVQPTAEGLKVANTADKGKLSPTVLLGEPLVAKDNERELAFELGKRLAYFRPERYVNYALSTMPKLEAVFYAALQASGHDVEGVGPDSAPLASKFKQTVPRAVLEQVRALANRMGVREKNGTLGAWRTATDLTANRVGLILCNDLETAARAVATETETLSTLPAKERLQDLLSYSVSEEYFAVRRHLGLARTEG